MRRLFALLAVLACLVGGGRAALAQGQPLPPGQPLPRPTQPQQLPPGHPPVGNPPPGARPMQPGQLPPGMRPPGGMPGMPARPPAPAEPAHAEHAAAEHCPGHGPLDPPPHINWWHGIIAVNNDKAGAEKATALDRLLWRYENPDDPCDEKNEPPPFLASVINFGILAFIVVRFGKKPLAEALVKRKQGIMQEIDNAARLKREAKARLKEYRKKFDTIEETLAEMKAEFATQAELDKQRMIAEAEERRDRMRRDAEFRVEQELKAARIELMHEAVQEAVLAAEALLKTKIEQGDLDQTAEDYLRSLGPAMSGAGATARPRPSGAPRELGGAS